MRSCEIAALPPSLRSGLRLTAMTIEKRARNDTPFCHCEAQRAEAIPCPTEIAALPPSLRSGLRLTAMTIVEKAVAMTPPSVIARHSGAEAIPNLVAISFQPLANRFCLLRF